MRGFYKWVPGDSLGSRFRKITLSLLLIILCGPAVFAQTGQVSGVVKDAQGNGMIGVNILVQGTTNGTVTNNLEGMFTLSGVDMDAVLIVSFLGYQTVEVPVGGRTHIEITLQDDVNQLDEVVVIGYGSLSKRELSSSIVQVSRDDFQKGAVSNPMELLAGKVAGLNINMTEAANPNNDPNIQIRGATSLMASNDPLIIIDGVIGGSLRSLSSQDIESMTVLKDAASAAIYGTRGSNGVILVTTKKGSGADGLSITYDSWFAVNLPKDGPSVLSADEFRRSRRGTDYGASTDWYDLLLRDFAFDNNQYIGINGNNQNGNYGASFNYKNATGLDIATKRNEYGGRFFIEQRVLNNRVQLGGSLNVRRVNERWGDGNMFDTALSMNPTMPLYNEDGSYYQPTSPTGANNPVAVLKDTDNNGQRLYVLGAVEAKLNIYSNANHSINTTLTYSMDYNDLKQAKYEPSTSGDSFWNGYNGKAEVRYQKWYKNRIEWLFNYTMNIGDHNLKVVGGYSWEDDNWEDFKAVNFDFAFDSTKWHDLGSGTFLGDGRAEMDTNKSLSKNAGIFARANYNWKDLIFASASFRYEGSTKFGKNNHYGFFPSASLAWEIANMEFMSDMGRSIQSLKPRISYGVTGRSTFDAYKSLATYSTGGENDSYNYLIDNQWVTGYRPSLNANPDLSWEKSVSTNIGVDFVFWNRLRGSIDYFDRQSRDLLYNYTAPQPPFIHNTILVNVGTTKNTGFEVALNYDVFNKNVVNWTTGINYSYGETKLKKLSNNSFHLSYLELYQKPGAGTSEHFFRVQEGARIGQFYGYEYAGVDQYGNMLVYDADDNVIPVGDAVPEDKRYIGNGTPKHYLSWSNTITYKNWDLDVFCQGAFGFDIFNMRMYGMGLKGSGSDNVLKDAYGKYNHITTGGGVISSFFLEKGDYFKISNVTLGYNFRFNNKHVENLRLFASAKNIYTITGYSGNDPSIVRTTGIEPGVDSNSAYPSALQLSVGITLRFR
ncbi:MAG: SusC/RagA family TonB-linked outer membrane protein [Alistipes sp.]|nr:SusC/RagA family TonB-linked outer membrane protein [Alistipes sp.]